MNPTIDLTGTKLGDAYTKAKSYLDTLGYKNPDEKEIAGAIEENDFMDVPTVMTDESARERIPELNATADRLAETGQFTDTTGELRNADGSLADIKDERDSEVSKLEGEASDLDKEIEDTLKSMRENSDADTARQVSAIQSQFNVRKNQLAQINAQNERATDFFLGGDMRYSKSANDISFTEKRFGIMELAHLDSMEQSLIAQVKSAQAAEDYKALDRLLTQTEKLRDEKKAKAKEISDAIAEDNKVLQGALIKTSRESTIADLFKQGITDAADIQNFLNYNEEGKLVGDVSLDEISKVLKIINPPQTMTGLTADYKTFKTMKETGELSDDIDYFDFQAMSANATRKPESPEDSEVSLAPEDERILTGAGFSSTDIQDLQKAVNEFGVDSVLEELDDDRKKRAVEKVYGVEQGVTREQIESSITTKSAQDALQDTYTEDELKDLADEYGYSSFFTGSTKDIERFLNSEDAKKLYADLLEEQYTSAGLFRE